MHTCTFIFIEPDHFSKSTVTAETRAECYEKYFLKYPERKDSVELTVVDGDAFDISYELKPKGEQ